MKKTTSILLIILTLLSLSACGKPKAKKTTSFDKGDAKVIAHRGLSGIEVENTEAAFIAAGEHSYYGIEADVRKTADGKFVMCHDDNLKKISGKDIAVETSTMAELQNVKLYGTEERLCDLATYIEICKKYDKQAILEVKSDFTEDEIAGIIEIINSHEYIDRVTFISFSYTNLEYVRAILPEQSVMYLFNKMSDETTEKLIRDRIDVAISYKELTKDALDKFHEAGLTVNCWTVDGKRAAEKLCDMGVDYITTNILE